MSRVLKFRWWHLDQMIREFDGWCEGTGINEALAAGEKYGAIAMQFTGLLDKHGVEIYEGDICNFVIGDQAISEARRVKIIWLRSAWGFEPVFPALVHPDDKEPRAFYVDPFEGDDWGAKYFEVIGDIHQNPELLEAK